MNIFINEFHYDNAGTDTGEFIEIAGPAGTDLTSWTIALYNGANGAVYDTITLSGVLSDAGDGVGFLVVDLPPNGLQNGPDGVALANATGDLVEFLSYEAPITAIGGPADGVTSVDIGVSESSSTPAGFSLQRVGTGAEADDFTFVEAMAETKGAANVGQIFGDGGTGGAPSLVINEILADPAADLTGDANGDGVRDATDDEFVEIVNASAEVVDISGYAISDANGSRHVFADGTTIAAGAAIVVFGGGVPVGDFGGAQVVTASAGSLSLNNGGDMITLSDANGLEVTSASYGGEGGDDQSLSRDPDLEGEFAKHSEIAGAAGALFSPGTNADGSPFAVGPPSFVINEIDSDQSGVDGAEFVELYDGGVGDASLDGLVLVLFNGNGDAAYDAIDLDGFRTDENGFFVIGSAEVPNVDLVSFTTNGLQNGADAVALYVGDASAFPSGTAATSEGLVDAVVYGTSDPDDAGLLAALGLSMQPDEDANGAKDTESLSRSPDGGDFVAQAPTPGETNEPPVEPPLEVKISEIQGSSDFSDMADPAQIGRDDVSALDGRTVTIQAIVTADFQSGANGVVGSDLSGFFVQEEESDYDDDAFTSEGLFVFDDFAINNPDVQIGDLVTITGVVGERFGQTQLSATSIDVIASNQMLPTATEVDLGGTGAILDAGGDFVIDLEAVEGMLITIPEAATVTELFNLDRFGEYRVAADGRLEQFTQNNAPDQEGFAAHLEENAARTLVLDDGRTDQNPDLLEIIDGNDGVLTAADSFRMGDEISNLTGVVRYSFDEFRLDDATGDYAQQNPRPDSPEDIGGTFKVASLNVLNYFTTLDTDPARGAPLTSGPDNDQEPRGADSEAEFERQAAKIVNAIVEIDADVLGLIELENDDDIAVADLVARVNAALGAEVYDFIATGDLGGDAITNGIIYKRDAVEPLGDFSGLFEFEGRDFIDPLGAGRGLNRPALAQTFVDLESGEKITVAVNHLKSKGSLSGLPEDEAQGDGQGNNNATRTEAASILADWLASDPTGQGAENVLILGDLNAYAQEDPLTTLSAAGFTDIAGEILGEDARSFVFDGQAGTLDYALANEALFEDLAGVTEWHINADEADAIDYNLDNDRDPGLYDGESAARNSDHDPVIVSFDFAPMIVGTEGRDTLIGTDRGEIIDGLGGRDKMTGNGGADTFVVTDRDHITDFALGEDRIDLTELGVQSLEELEVFGWRKSFTIVDEATGARIRVKADDETVRAHDFTEDSFIFAPVEDLTLIGGDGFDRLVGRAGDDVIDGGGGFNLLTGNGGADTFVIAEGRGSIITDFEGDADLIDLSAWDAAGIEDLHIRDRFLHVEIRDGGDVLRLSKIDNDVSADDLLASSFIFAGDAIV